MDNLIPMAAFITAIGTFLFAFISLRKKATNGYVGSLRERLEDAEYKIVKLEKKLTECETMRKQLQNENIELMRRIVSPDDR